MPGAGVWATASREAHFFRLRGFFRGMGLAPVSHCAARLFRADARGESWLAGKAGDFK